MLTFDPSLSAELARASPDIRRIVTFYLTSSEDGSISVCDGESSIFGYTPSVATVKPAGLSIDVFTREVSAAKLEIVMRADGVARALVRDQYVVGKLVVVKLGTPNVDEENWLVEWCGIIEDPVPNRGGEITFRCLDGFAYLMSLRIRAGWISLHPISVMLDILTNHLPAALWSSTGFDAEVDSTKSHWNLSRYEVTNGRLDTALERRLTADWFGKPVEDGLLDVPRVAWELLQELMTLNGGTLRLDAAGRIEMARYDQDAAPVRHWTAMDYFEWDQPSSAGDIANRVEVGVTLGSGSAASFFTDSANKRPLDRTISDDALLSQGDLGSVGSGVLRVLTRSLKSDWIRSIGVHLASDVDLDDTATTITVPFASQLGFCGARYRYGFGTNSVSGLGITASSITGNVLTMTIPGHFLGPGARITTTTLSANLASPTDLTIIDTNTVSAPLVSADDPSNGAGYALMEQSTLDKLDSGGGGDRAAWFLLASENSGSGENQAIVTNTFEIVKAIAGVSAGSTSLDPLGVVDGFPSLHSAPTAFEYDILRAQRGTVAQNWNGGITHIYDITIAIGMIEQRLARFAYGVGAVTLKTKFAELAVQLGDFVTHDAEMYVAHGIDGATSADVFEVVSKNIDKDANPPCISWVLKYVRTDA